MMAKQMTILFFSFSIDHEVLESMKRDFRESIPEGNIFGRLARAFQNGMSG